MNKTTAILMRDKLKNNGVIAEIKGKSPLYYLQITVGKIVGIIYESSNPSVKMIDKSNLKDMGMMTSCVRKQIDNALCKSGFRTRS